MILILKPLALKSHRRMKLWCKSFISRFYLFL
jgi:hypothetical protein